MIAHWSTEVHERFKARVLLEELILLKIQLDGVHVDFEEEARINLVYIFWLLVRLLTWKEVSESEITVHHRVEIINFDAVLIYHRLLMVAQEAWEPAHYTFARGTSALLFTFEPPIT
jgi:hypothetical protein